MKTGVVMLGVAAAVVAVAVQEESKVDVVAARKYSWPEGRFVEGEGVCTLSTEGADCWNMDGVRDKDLSERIKSYFLTNSNDVSIRVGRRNRWLVVRQSQPYGGNFQLPHAGYTWSTQISYQPNGPTETIVRYLAEPDETTASVIALTYFENKEKVPPIAFKDGAELKAGEMRIEIGKWKELPRNAPAPNSSYPGAVLNGPTGGFQAGGRRWSVVIGCTTPGGANRYGFPTFVPLDSNGTPILFVDKNGQPTRGVKVLEDQDPARWDGQIQSRRYATAVFMTQGQQMQDAAIYQTNVDPRKIASLQMSVPMKQFSVQIDGFPLEPAK